MPTANEDLRDAFLRHQIFLMQGVGTINKDVIGILDKSEADMLTQVRKQTSRSGDKITKANQVRLARLQDSITAIRGEAWDNVKKEWNVEAFQLLNEQQEFLASSFETVSPTVVNIATVAPPLLRSIVTTHPFEGKTLKEWADTVKRADLARIMDQVKIGMVQGESSEQIARRIVGTVGQRGRNGVTQISRRNAAAITRTMVNDFSNQANQTFFQENRDLIQFEVYTATLDSRTTPICQSLDGKRFPVGEGAVPPLHFACRSVRIPVLDPDSLTGVDRPFKAFTEKGLLDEFTRNNKLKRVSSRKKLPRGFKGRFDKFARKRAKQLTGNVPASMSYQDWLKTQSPAFQDQILGKTKGQLFRQGGLTLDKFVDKRFNPVTISQLRTLNQEAFKKAGLVPVQALDARKLGVGQRATELLLEGKNVDDVLKTILAEFPEAKTTKASIQWYKSQLKKKGTLPGTTVKPVKPKTPGPRTIAPAPGTEPPVPPRKPGFRPADTSVTNWKNSDKFRDRTEELVRMGHGNKDVEKILRVEFPNIEQFPRSFIPATRTRLKKLGVTPVPTRATAIPGSPLNPNSVLAKPKLTDRTEVRLARNKAIREEIDFATRGQPGKTEVEKWYKEFMLDMDAAPIVIDNRLFEKTGGSQLKEIFASTQKLHEGRRGSTVLGSFWHTNRIGIQTRSSKSTFIHEYFHHLDYTSLRAGTGQTNFWTKNLLRKDIDGVKAQSIRRVMEEEMRDTRKKIVEYITDNSNSLDPILVRDTLGSQTDLDFTKHWRSLYDIPNHAVPRPSNYATYSIEEWIAESGQLYFTNRGKLREVAPRTYEAIEDWLSGGVF